MNKFGLRTGNLISESDAVTLYEELEDLRSEAHVYGRMGTKGDRYAAKNEDVRLHSQNVAKIKKERANALHRALFTLGVRPLPKLL